MSHRAKIALVFTLLVLGGSSSLALARTENLSETAALRLDNHHGLVLNEHGIARGTIKAVIYIQLKVSSTRSVTAQIQIYPSGGLMRGSATAQYSVVGSYANFRGTMNITSGNGKYAKARGYGLSFSGRIRRTDDAVTVYMNGKLYY